MSQFTDAMAFRHACKTFDAQKAIPAEQFDALLETVRQSPSSFGMEPWRLIIVRSPEVREALKPLCWNQSQITDGSELVIFTTDNEAVKGGTAYVRKMFERRGLNAEMTAAYMQRYAEYLVPMEADERLLENWTAKQCYIAAANLMTHAAAMQIDSCPIEGFEKEKVEAFLELPKGHHVALIVVLGYRAGEQSEQCRLAKEEIVSFL